MAKYRKTALVEAVETFLDEETNEIAFKDQPGWLVGALMTGKIFSSGRSKKLYISTLEGNMEVTASDWVCRGVKGELWPIKADIFAETYEKVED